jgi:LysM repeat protein
MVLLAINNFGSSCPIKPGDKILIPAVDTQLPTETPIPADIGRGTKINYIVKLGDSMDGIASKFNTTVEDILLQNKIDDANTLFAGQELIIRVNLVTPTPTIAPTSTTAATTVPTATVAPTATRIP